MTSLSATSFLPSSPTDQDARALLTRREGLDSLQDFIVVRATSQPQLSLSI